ncbi:MAG: GxxExxY protein, partial [Flavitalea sp.]
MLHEKREDQISNIVIRECLKIHRTVGPGLFESVYEKILYHELSEIGLSVNRQVPIKVWYNSIDFGIGFKAD